MNSINLTELMPFGQAMGWTIIHSVWQIALIALALRLVLFLIPQKKSSVRYILSLTALTLALVWSAFTFSEKWNSTDRLVHDSLTTSVIDLKTSANEQIFPIENFDIVEKNSPFIGLSLKGFFLEKSAYFSYVIKPHLPLIALCWYIGALLFSCYMLSGFFYLNRLNKKGLIEPTVEWQQKFEQLREQMGIRIPVQFSISKLVKEPLTFYFFKPVVLAPISIFTGLTPDQIEVLLLHELAHIRRFDFGINIFQSLIEVLFFYHPLAWWISKNIRIEREHCCDDLVIQIRNNPQLYAEALTKVQLHHLTFKTQLAMSINGNNNGSFSKRIFRLFGHNEQKPSFLKGFMMAILLVIGFLTQSSYLPSTEFTDRDISVSIDWNNPINRNHMLFETFSKWSPEKIKDLYLQNEKYRNFNASKRSSILVTDKYENNSLIFTVTENSKTFMDTLQNYVNPNRDAPISERYPEKDFKIVRKKMKKGDKSYGEGSIPTGTVAWVDINRKGIITTGVELENKPATVKILVLSSEQKVVTVLVDKTLEQGTHEYTWNDGPNKTTGTHYVKIMIDDHTRTQKVDIK